MSITKMSLALVWYALLLFEIVIWGSTTVQLGWPGLISLIAYAMIVPLLLGVEGLELAVANLLSSKANLSPAAARELDHIRADPTLPFFPNRQLLVVGSIVVLTMASAFEQVYVPGFGWTTSYNLPTLLNLVLPTHVVLVCAQVPGKMLALYDPSRFFNQTWWICVAVRWIEAFEVTNPAKLITNWLAMILGYPVRHTPPTPEIRLVYPVFDTIDNQWVYVVQEEEKAGTEGALT